MKAPKVIYYLDDDTDDLYFFKEVAETLGHNVSIFINGTEMLRTLGKELPDIIFLDIRMPVFNGEEILHVIKKTPQWNHIPVVMISGGYPKSMIRHYLESGANYLMKKPDFSDMKPALEQVLGIDWKNFQAYI
jgi:CheY-like chemotaxis protein